MHQTINKYLLIPLLIFSLLILQSCSNKPQNINDSIQAQEINFNEYLNTLFIDELKNTPMQIHFKLVNPENFGLKDVRPHMEQLTEETFNKQVKRYTEIVKKLNSFKNLSKQDSLNRDILLHYYNTELLAKDLFPYMEILSPSLGIQSNLPIFFAEYTFDSKQDIIDYLTLLDEIPVLFDQIIEFEQMKTKKGLLIPDFAIADITNQMNSFISNNNSNFLLETFEDKINNFNGLSKEEKEKYIDLNIESVNNKMIPAYKKLITSMNSLKGQSVNDKGLYYFKDGTKFYEYLYKSYTGSTTPILDIAKQIETNITSIKKDLDKITSSNPELVETYSTLSNSFDSPEDTIIYLKNKINDEFTDIEAANLKIKYVHPSLEDFLSPAFYLIPPIDEKKSQVIYINKATDYLDTQLFITIAHESYPGHLYQNNYFSHLNNIPKLRKLINFDGYMEGWATYAQIKAIHYLNQPESIESLIKSDSLLGSLIMARVDIGINYEGWTKEDTINYLNKVFPNLDADMFYNTCIEEPANILKYVVGYLEIENLKNSAKNLAKENFKEKDFHDFILSTGPAPFYILEQELKTYYTRNNH